VAVLVVVMVVITIQMGRRVVVGARVPLALMVVVFVAKAAQEFNIDQLVAMVNAQVLNLKVVRAQGIQMAFAVVTIICV